MVTETNIYRETLEDLARSRGMSGAEELAERAADLDPEHTAREFLEAPPGGFGDTLDRILDMTPEERVRLLDAFKVRFLGSKRKLRRDLGLED